MKYRKKPVEIEAMQFTEENKSQVFHWITCTKSADRDGNGKPTIKILTLEGIMTVCVGDYIIKGVKGEFYPCKPDIFEMTYEPVEEFDIELPEKMCLLSCDLCLSDCKMDKED